MNKWIKLDNAAIVFPPLAKTNNPAIFRLAFVLTEDVQPQILQTALDKTLGRYPLMTLCIRKGLFWRYMEQGKQPVIVQKEEEYPCAPLKHPLYKEPLIKVLYYQKRIALEVFHAVTDGTGAVEFLKTLIYEYLRLTGKPVMPEGLIKSAEEKPLPEELEDGFDRYYNDAAVNLPRYKKAYQIKGTYFEPFGHNVIHGVMSAGRLNALAKKHNVSITVFLLALLIQAICQNEPVKMGRPVTVSVPVNLRNFFPTESLRNFFAVTNVSVDCSAAADFSGILKAVQEQMTENTRRSRLQEAINRNISFEKILIARFIPLIAKDFIVSRLFFHYNDKLRTCTLTNLGRIQLPESILPYVRHMELVFYPTYNNPINCGICSVNDRLTITFTRTIKENRIIAGFFRSLAQEYGLEIEIYSNEWGNSY